MVEGKEHNILGGNRREGTALYSIWSLKLSRKYMNDKEIKKAPTAQEEEAKDNVEK